MRIKLCWKTKDLDPKKYRYTEFLSIKAAMKYYEKIEAIATRAWLSRFLSYHDVTYKVLKESHENATPPAS